VPLGSRHTFSRHIIQPVTICKLSVTSKSNPVLPAINANLMLTASPDVHPAPAGYPFLPAMATLAGNAG
jgi:hypothetical protein